MRRALKSGDFLAVARRDLLERRLVRDSKHERDSTQLSLALKTDKRGQEPRVTVKAGNNPGQQPAGTWESHSYSLREQNPAHSLKELEKHSPVVPLTRNTALPPS